MNELHYLNSYQVTREVNLIYTHVKKGTYLTQFTQNSTLTTTYFLFQVNTPYQRIALFIFKADLLAAQHTNFWKTNADKPHWQKWEIFYE